MKEHQNLEWKVSWRDEYLRWICGFASAEGGVLVKAPVETRVKTPVETPVKTPELILGALRAKPDWTLAELAQSLGKSQSAVERAAAKLVKAGKLRFVGPKKGGYWEVMK